MEQNRYEIIKLLGKGRTGGVYEAEDTVLGRRVALRRFFDLNGEADHSKWEDSFVAIAQNLCALQHPNIATVFDAGVDDDGAYIVSQLLNGKSFDDRLTEGPINEWDVYQTTESIFDALTVAHESGFIHGAFNPSSIIRVPRASGGYRNYIVDLGLSRLAPLIQGDSSSLALMAEPTMMAPEQFDGSPATVRSDIYMVGQFAYICLIGGHPFSGKTLEEVVEAHENEELQALHEYPEGVSLEMSDWVHSLIKKNPEDRPESIEAALASMPKLEKPIDLEKMQAVAAKTSLVNVSAATATATTTLNPLLNAVPASPTLVASGPLTTGLPHTGLNPLATAAPTVGIMQSVSGNLAGVAGPTARMTGATLANNGKKKSSMPVILAAAGVVVLIIAAIIMFSASGDDETEEVPAITDNNEESSLKVPSLGDQPISHDNEVDNSETTDSFRITFLKPKFLYKWQKVTHKSPQKLKLNYFSEWLIETGKTKSVPQREGETFQKFECYNCKLSFTETSALKFASKVKFAASQLKSDSETGQLKQETGYRIKGKFPQGTKNEEVFRVYLSGVNISAKIQVKTASGANFESESLDIKNGSNFITLLLAGAVAGEDFEIFVMMDEKKEMKFNSMLAFNGIVRLK